MDRAKASREQGERHNFARVSRHDFSTPPLSKILEPRLPSRRRFESSRAHARGRSVRGRCRQEATSAPRGDAPTPGGVAASGRRAASQRVRYRRAGGRTWQEKTRGTVSTFTTARNSTDTYPSVLGGSALRHVRRGARAGRHSLGQLGHGHGRAGGGGDGGSAGHHGDGEGIQRATKMA